MKRFVFLFYNKQSGGVHLFYLMADAWLALAITSYWIKIESSEDSFL